jgi:hypothetical protein
MPNELQMINDQLVAAVAVGDMPIGAGDGFHANWR